MTTYLAIGNPDQFLSDQEVDKHVRSTLGSLGEKQNVLAVVPDITRRHSYAGPISQTIDRFYGDQLTDVLPALGTHRPMTDGELDRMYTGITKSKFREHRWREDVLTIGEVPASFVKEVTQGVYNQPWPAQLNQLVCRGGHDLIVSVGQVVPHEVIGMANYNKNLFVGTGGSDGINESHFIGAAYGMEKAMGRSDSPLRKILNYAQDHFCQDLPVLYILTVVDTDENGDPKVKGLYIGDDHDCFEQACLLSQQVNITQLDDPIQNAIVYLDPEEFHTTWLGNKAIYRTRMAMADEGNLIILGPEIQGFGEDDQIDQLIRKYGYRDSETVLKLVDENEDLRNNLSAAAHLIHGSPEGRFNVTYCPGKLTKQEIESVGYQYGDLDWWTKRLPEERATGQSIQIEDQSYFYIDNPALGLWSTAERFAR